MRHEDIGDFSFNDINNYTKPEMKILQRNDKDFTWECLNCNKVNLSIYGLNNYYTCITCKTEYEIT